MQLNLEFRNEEQSQYFWHRERNGLFGGGFGNGKSYVGCQRAFIHLATFPGYRMAICRQKYKTLKSTTMATFFKICPQEFIYRHDIQDGYTVLLNKSLIYWMHLDAYAEEDLRGLEINSVLIDQAEEINEEIYLVMDVRVGRWDQAKVPNHLLYSQVRQEDREELDLIRDVPKEFSKRLYELTKWPKNKWGVFKVPNYLDCLSNPSEDDEFHWTYRRYDPNSIERLPKHFFISRKTDDDLNDEGTILQYLNRDKEWVDKYYYGKTGSPKARIHNVNPLSIINPDDYVELNDKGQTAFEVLIDTIKRKAALYRVLDHADTGITTCGWFAAINGVHIFYREYYVEATLISDNRRAITDLSFDEEYLSDLADPSIFKKDRQKIDGMQAGFTSVADEYTDTEVSDAPPLYWLPADNNEFATRNRINELLNLNSKYFHPITRVSPAPGIYFIQRSTIYPFGADKAIIQIKNQKRKLLGTDNGKKIYSEERDPNIVDHAYDLLRYYVAAHSSEKSEPKRKPPKRSFAYFNALLKRRTELREGSLT